MSASVTVKLDMSGVLNYAKASKQAEKDIKGGVRKALNTGRKVARQRIASEFQVRTGFLRRQARKMQTSVSVRSDMVGGKVAPLPRLLNIFEGGAVLAHGRGILHPRPVLHPAAEQMKTDAERILNTIVKGVGA